MLFRSVTVPNLSAGGTTPFTVMRPVSVIVGMSTLNVCVLVSVTPLRISAFGSAAMPVGSPCPSCPTNKIRRTPGDDLLGRVAGVRQRSQCHAVPVVLFRSVTVPNLSAGGTTPFTVICPLSVTVGMSTLKVCVLVSVTPLRINVLSGSVAAQVDSPCPSCPTHKIRRTLRE